MNILVSVYRGLYVTEDFRPNVVEDVTGIVADALLELDIDVFWVDTDVREP